MPITENGIVENGFSFAEKVILNPVNISNELKNEFLKGEIITGLSIRNFLDMIGEAKRMNVKIELHPNGFLQLPLDSSNKRLASLQLHIRHESIERRGKKEYEIHDHAFDIESYIITGSLQDETYSIIEDINGKYIVFQGDTKGQLISESLSISLIGGPKRTIVAGNSYIIKKGDFHSSNKLSPNTATLIRKSNIDLDYKSKVIIPIHETIDKVEVNRNFDQTEARKLVDEVINVITKRK